MIRFQQLFVSRLPKAVVLPCFLFPKQSHLIYLDQIVLSELGFSGIDVVDDLAEMIDVAFRVERVGGNLKGNAVLPGNFLAKIVNAVVIESPISAQTSSMLRFRSGSIRKFTLTAFAILIRLLLDSIICVCNEKRKNFHYIINEQREIS